MQEEVARIIAVISRRSLGHTSGESPRRRERFFGCGKLAVHGHRSMPVVIGIDLQVVCEWLKGSGTERAIGGWCVRQRHDDGTPSGVAPDIASGDLDEDVWCCDGRVALGEIQEHTLKTFGTRV